MRDYPVLERIIDRLGQNPAAEGMFGADEVAEWPDGFFDKLLKAGLLKTAQPASSLECRGCEQSCPMPVHVLVNEENRPPRAFISCDKRDDIGRVSVDIRRLVQWRLTGHSLAQVVSRLLGFSQGPRAESQEAPCWLLGVLQGKKRRGEVRLSLNGAATLAIAGNSLPLTEILELDGAGLKIERAVLLRLVDNPATQANGLAASSFKPRREARKLKTQQRYLEWRKAAKELRKKPLGTSDRWVSQQIAKMPIGEGANAETIRKKIRL